MYEIESINNANRATVAVNPKEYFEKYKDKNINRKHRKFEKDTPGMTFEAYAARIMSLDELMHPKPKKITQNRFQIKNAEMRMQSISKTQFAGLNDKFYFFYDDIVSLPFGYSFPEDLGKKKERKKHIFIAVYKRKRGVLKSRGACCKRLRFLRSTLLQSTILYKLDLILFCKSLTKLSTNNYVLNSHWL